MYRSKSRAESPIMPIKVACLECNRIYELPDGVAGRKGKCECGAILDVPAATPRAPKPPRTLAKAGAIAEDANRPKIGASRLAKLAEESSNSRKAEDSDPDIVRDYRVPPPLFEASSIPTQTGQETIPGIGQTTASLSSPARFSNGKSLESVQTHQFPADYSKALRALGVSALVCCALAALYFTLAGIHETNEKIALGRRIRIQMVGQNGPAYEATTEDFQPLYLRIAVAVVAIAVGVTLLMACLVVSQVLATLGEAQKDLRRIAMSLEQDASA